jgi:hypothetical protein
LLAYLATVSGRRAGTNELVRWSVLRVRGWCVEEEEGEEEEHQEDVRVKEVGVRSSPGKAPPLSCVHLLPSNTYTLKAGLIIIYVGGGVLVLVLVLVWWCSRCPDSPGMNTS